MHDDMGGSCHVCVLLSLLCAYGTCILRMFLCHVTSLHCVRSLLGFCVHHVDMHPLCVDVSVPLPVGFTDPSVDKNGVHKLSFQSFYDVQV